MLTLAIDCSARLCAVALHQGDTDAILAAASPDIGRGHAEQLPAILQSVLDRAARELGDVERIGVTVGPGSFAGIRVGVAFARGLALALSVPCVGVGSLEAIAIPAARRTGRPVKPWSWADTWPVARIIVPRIGRSAIALAGASGQALAFGLGVLITIIFLGSVLSGVGPRRTPGSASSRTSGIRGGGVCWG